MVYSNSNHQTGPITMYCWDTASNETCGMINLDRVVNTQTPNTSAPVALDGKVELGADKRRAYGYDLGTRAPSTIASSRRSMWTPLLLF